MSTFSGLNTAHSGLAAARRALDVVGQNVANANTAGYTRQRVLTSAVGAANPVGMAAGGVRPGQGVSIDGIARLGSANLDAQVRFTAGGSGYSAIRANAMSAVEMSLHEPGENGLSARLNEFWAAWQDLSNRAGESAPAELLIVQANALASSLADGYHAVDAQWTQVRRDLDGMVAELNATASQVAELNGRIRKTVASGGSPNELLDQRNLLTTTLAALSGATLRDTGDGAVDVLVGGNTLVSGVTFQALRIDGATRMDAADGDPPRLEWAERSGVRVTADGGEIAGALSVLAPADDGRGGSIAEVASSYNAFARDLADKVNAVHRTGSTRSGVTGLDFFQVDSRRPAQTLSVTPSDAADIASGAPGAGGRDGTIADRIAQLGVSADSPSAAWSSLVTTIGVATRSALQQASLADLAATSAVNMQLSNSAVDLDEENVNLLMFQHAYQGAARVLTAVDEMLDTLINRTGIVGR
ncbi:MAG: flagellar biosynthesis protein FlgK [Cryobacterium sp.]|nr:flagellar biosynthesis protein FlgK [Cryobacterium sp.]